MCKRRNWCPFKGSVSWIIGSKSSWEALSVESFPHSEEAGSESGESLNKRRTSSFPFEVYWSADRCAKLCPPKPKPSIFIGECLRNTSPEVPPKLSLPLVSQFLEIAPLQNCKKRTNKFYLPFFQHHHHPEEANRGRSRIGEPGCTHTVTHTANLPDPRPEGRKLHPVFCWYNKSQVA